jgi:hypothetical protein
MNAKVVRNVVLILIAAAGLIAVATEVVRLALVDQFSAGIVLAGLVAIGLAEYLWTAPMKHRLMRAGLLAMEAFIAVSAIDGGAALLRGKFAQYVTVEWLAGTPFSDYTFPGLVLVGVVGGTALLAAMTVFIYRQWALLVSLLAGLVMAGFLIVEAAILDPKVGGDLLPIVLGMQLLYFVPGVAIAVLARYLWTIERSMPIAASRPRQSKQARRASERLAA